MYTLTKCKLKFLDTATGRTVTVRIRPDGISFATLPSQPNIDFSISRMYLDTLESHVRGQMGLYIAGPTITAENYPQNGGKGSAGDTKQEGQP